MVSEMSDANAQVLEREIDWFGRVLEARIALYFGHDSEVDSISQIIPPTLDLEGSAYGQLVEQLAMEFDERIVLILALLPHIRPQLLDTFFIQNKNFERNFTEFGGWTGRIHGGFLPSCETAAFILAGNDLSKRFALMPLFENDHAFIRQGVLRVDHQEANEPFFSATLQVTNETLKRLTVGDIHKPDYSIHFPAKLIRSSLQWDDLVLGSEARAEVENINTWIQNAEVLMSQWGLEKNIKPGYRSLFYGPPGTGKTLTATLIGARAGVDVYRVDLSMVVSKYIGETEKNLAGLFDQAENKNWILFFDEADALFGKRTSASSANDRYANQEVSYLLQRIEDHPGVVILASNLKGNIDEAFSRRFQSLVYFPMPDSEQRYSLWQCALNGGKHLADEVDLEQLAEAHELAGGAITNVVRYGAISALQAGRDKIHHNDLVRGITKELRKEGRTL